MEGKSGAQLSWERAQQWYLQKTETGHLLFCFPPWKGGGQGTDVGGLLTAGALRIKGCITFIDPEVGRVRERVWGKG